MLIDYSKYSLEELLDVKENIDSEKYAQRYKNLIEEIELRRNTPEEKQLKQKRVEFENEQNHYRRIDFLEFGAKGDEKIRLFFIIAFISINLVFLWWAIPKYNVTPLAKIHEFRTVIDSAVCKTETVHNNETNTVTRYYDFYIESYPDTFTAIGISKSQCQKLARTLTDKSEVSVWHIQGIVYQIASNEGVVLPYTYMKKIIYKQQTKSFQMNWFLLIGVWVLCFQSLANAFFPGTFVKKNPLFH